MMSANTVRLGFQEGCLDRADLEAWIVERVATLDPLPPALLNLVPLTARDDSEVDALLGALAEPTTPEDAARIRIDLVCLAFRRGRIDLQDAARRLELIAITHFDSLPADLASAAAGLDDGLYLASTGTYGTVAEAEEAVRAFVGEFGRPLAT